MPLALLGYDGVIQNQTGNNTNQPCGVATFWSRKAFTAFVVKYHSRSLVVGLEEVVISPWCFPPLLSVHAAAESCSSSSRSSPSS